MKNPRQKIQKVCKRLYKKNMLASADGNVSYRISDDEILITPSGISKAHMDPDKMAVINLAGEVLKGTPSSERSMHLEVYRRCPKARAVVHAHPPYAIAWSIAFPELKMLPAEAMSELILAMGDVPFVPFALPGTEAMGSNLAEFLPQHRVMILSRHGGLAWGEDLDEAYFGMERLEHSAQILFLARQMGEIQPLSVQDVARLRELRAKIGERTL